MKKEWLEPFVGLLVRGTICIEGVGEDGDYRTFAGRLGVIDDFTVFIDREEPLDERAGTLTYVGDGFLAIGQITELVGLPDEPS